MVIFAAGIFVGAGIFRPALADSSPVLSGVTVTNVAATSTTIMWTSDKKNGQFYRLQFGYELLRRPELGRF